MRRSGVRFLFPAPHQKPALLQAFLLLLLHIGLSPKLLLLVFLIPSVLLESFKRNELQSANVGGF